MTHEKTRFISYLWPKCRQSVIVEKDVFALAAAPARIQCPCGQSELTIEFMPQRVSLRVPCVACGREHFVSCPTHAFLREKALALFEKLRFPDGARIWDSYPFALSGGQCLFG